MSLPYNLRPKKEKKKSNFLVNIFLVLVFLFMLAGFAVLGGYRFWYQNGISKPISSDTQEVAVVIESGTSSQKIGQILLEKGLIKDTNLWNLYIRLNKPSLFAQNYVIPKNLSIEEIVTLLSSPPNNKSVWITFPEGISSKKVIDIVESEAGKFVDGNFSISEFSSIINDPDSYNFSSENQEFLDKYKPKGKPLEGFLYPNTYAFDTKFEAMDIVNVLLDEFRSQVSGLDLESGSNSFYEILTVASIVEKEGLTDSDREVIASVFTNRIKDGWKLESDATINFFTEKSDRRATYEDLAIDSPYNTYKNLGLPPTPIANPRFQAIKVTLNPIETDYYFFLHDEDGTPYYGRNENEHFSNVSKYLDN